MTIDAWNIDTIKLETWEKLLDEATKKENRKFLGMSGRKIKIFSYSDFQSQKIYRILPLSELIKSYNDFSLLGDITPSYQKLEMSIKSKLLVLMCEIAQTSLKIEVGIKIENPLKNALGDFSWMDIFSLNEKDFIHFLMKMGDNINILDECGEAALILAIKMKKTRVVEILLKLNANPNIKNNLEQTPLILAISTVIIDPFIIEMLLKHGAVCAPSILKTFIQFLDSYLPLNEEKFLKSIQLLIKAGADINLLDEFGSSLLYDIISSKKCRKETTRLMFVKILLSCEANPNTITIKRNLRSLSKERFTQDAPYFFAKKNGMKEIQEALLLAGAQDNKGNTLLMEAIENNNIIGVKLYLTLKSFQKSLEIFNDAGYNPLRHAALFDKKEIVDLLLQAGANPNITNRDGLTILEELASKETVHRDIFQSLLSAGACFLENSVEKITITSSPYFNIWKQSQINNHYDYLEVLLAQWRINQNLIKKEFSLKLTMKSENPVDDIILKVFSSIFLSANEKYLKLFYDSGISINSLDTKGNSVLSYIVDQLTYQFDLLTYKSIKRLLKLGANPLINEKTTDGMLFASVQAENPKMVQMMLSNEANILVRNFVGCSPLQMAVISGNLPIIEQLILCLQKKMESFEKENGTKILHNSIIGDAMAEAIRLGAYKTIKLFLSAGFSPNTLDRFSNPLLLIAAENNKYKIVKLLIKAGVNLDLKNIKGSTALEIAIKKIEIDKENVNAKKISELLWVCGARDQHGNNVLIVAVYARNISAIKKIISETIPRKIDIDAQNNAGSTALLEASIRGKDYFDIINLLLECGANPFLTNHYKQSVFMHNAVQGNLSAIKYLIKLGVNIESKDILGHTPLMWAAGSLLQNHLVIEELIKNGAKLETEDYSENTALKIAFLHNLNHVQILLDAGARDIQGSSILMQMIQRGESFEVIEKLMNECLDVNETNNFGDSAAFQASYLGRVDVLEALVERGADLTISNLNLFTPLSAAMAYSPPTESSIKYLLGEIYTILIDWKKDFSTVFKLLYENPIDLIDHLLASSDLENKGIILAIPYLLNNSKLAEIIFQKLTQEEINNGLNALQEIFPKSSFTKLCESTLHINEEHFILNDEDIVPKISKPIDIGELLVMFDQLNTSYKELPGYCNPALIKDDGSPTHLKNLRSYLIKFISAIKAKKSFFGSPPDPLPTDLDLVKDSKLNAQKQYFETLENLVKILIVKLQDPSIDQDKKTSALLDLAVAGNHCGARYISECRAWVNLLSPCKETMSLLGIINQNLTNYRIGILEKLSNRFVKHTGDNPGQKIPIGNRSHTYNQYLSFIGKIRGIPGFETAHEDHAFWHSEITSPKTITYENGTTKLLPGTALMEFDNLYNPTSLIDCVMEIDSNLFFMWFKDRVITTTWKKERFETIEKEIVEKYFQNLKELKSIGDLKLDEELVKEVKRLLLTFWITSEIDFKNPEAIDKAIAVRMERPPYIGKSEIDKTKEANKIRQTILPLLISKDKQKAYVDHMIKRSLIQNGIGISDLKDPQDEKEVIKLIHDKIEWDRCEAFLDEENIRDPVTGKITRQAIIEMLTQLRILSGEPVAF